MKRSVRLSHFTAAMCMLASVGTAHSDDYVSATTVNLDGLQYRLIDLAPDDGIAPGIAINGQWHGSQLVLTPGDYYPTSVGIFSGESNKLFGSGGAITGSSPDGAVGYVLGTDQVSLTSKLASTPFPGAPTFNSRDNSYTYQDETGQWFQRTDRTTDGYTERQKSAAGGAVGTDSVSGATSAGPTRITLTANTLLILEGTLNLGMSADRSFLADKAAVFEDLLGENASYMYVDARGRVSTQANVSLTRGAFGDYGQIDDAYAGGTEGGTFTSVYGNLFYDGNGFSENGAFGDGAPIDDALTRTRTLTKNLALSYANISGSSQDLSLSITLSSELSEEFFASGQAFTVVSNVPLAIPEPGTYALMGLGLGSLALVRRREACRQRRG